MIVELIKSKIKVCEEKKAILEDKIAKEKAKKSKDRNDFSIWYWKGNIVSIEYEIIDLRFLINEIKSDGGLLDDKLY